MAVYRITPAQPLDPARLEAFQEAGQWIMLRHSPKGSREIDLKAAVRQMDLDGEDLLLAAGSAGGRPKPVEVLTSVFGLSARRTPPRRPRPEGGSQGGRARLMASTLLINSRSYETRVALLENGQCVEVYVERHKQMSLAGNVYLGRVARVLPGMQAAFVDIGLPKAAFLYVSDVYEPPEEMQWDAGEVPPEAQRSPGKPHRADAARGPGDHGAGGQRAPGQQGRPHHQPRNLCRAATWCSCPPSTTWE